MTARPFALEPPKHITPERLFRILSDPEGPRLAIDYRITGAENVPLEVRAPTARAFAIALDQEGDDTTSKEAAQRRALIATTLWSGGMRAFGTFGEVGQLYASEFAALEEAVLVALEVVAPSSCYSHRALWWARLKEGSKVPSNWPIALAMAHSQDLVSGFKPPLVPRPERYYGRPVCELTEGQMMAYEAACSAVHDAVGG